MQFFPFFYNFVYFLLSDRLNIHDFHSYLIWYWFFSSSNDPAQKYLNLLIFNNFLFFYLLPEVLYRNFFLPFEILCCSIFSHSSFSLYWIYLPCISILLDLFFFKKRCVFFRRSSIFALVFPISFSVSWLLSFQIFCSSFLLKSRKGSSLLSSPFPQFSLPSYFLISLLFLFVFHSVFNPPSQCICCAYNFTVSSSRVLFLKLFLVFLAIISVPLTQ